MFGKPSITKEYAGLIEQLQHGDRRPANHVRPSSVTDSGFESFATGDVQAVFEGFEYFAAILHHHIAGPWTIEETGDTLVKDLMSDSPDLGRTYQVFYNDVKLGRLQVTAGPSIEGIGKDVDWHREHRSACVILDLQYLRFIHYADVLSLVSNIELLVGPFEDGDVARPRARSLAAEVLSGHLWEMMRGGDDYVPTLDHRVTGPYDLLKEVTDHWKAGNLDPFERWNGDIPS